MKTEAREKILTEGARIVHRKGFNNTGIAEIVAAAQVPKGSFYFYFSSKEAFGLELVDHYIGYLSETARQAMASVDGTPLERLKGFFKTFNDFFVSNDFKDGCPIGNLCQEMADVNEAFRDKLGAALGGMQGLLELTLKQAEQEGELAPGQDLAELAGFILNSWQGALLRMKVEKGPGPLDAFMKLVFERLLTP